MAIINRYKTKNIIIMQQRLKSYLNNNLEYYKDFRLNNASVINYAGRYKEIPDDVTILTDYTDQIGLRSSFISSDIILHSIYIKYPELFEY